jgi:hypothetical protein
MRTYSVALLDGTGLEKRLLSSCRFQEAQFDR